MTNIKTLIATLIALGTLSSAGTVLAAPGSLVLESILVREDVSTITVEYGSKARGCAWLMDEDGTRVQATYKDFCGQGANQVAEYDLSGFDVMGGDVLYLCAQNDINNCSGRVEVRQAGDLDGDGGLNVADLMLIHEYIMEGNSSWWPTQQLDMDAADLNGDGAVNVIDILLLVDHIWANE